MTDSEKKIFLEQRAALQKALWDDMANVAHALKDFFANRQEGLTLSIDCAPIPTETGGWRLAAFGDKTTGQIHEVLIKGSPEKSDGPVPIFAVQGHHISETFDERGSGHKAKIHDAMMRFNERGEGILIYLHADGDGGGILEELSQLNVSYRWDGNKIVGGQDQVGTDHQPRYYDPDIVRDIISQLGIEIDRVNPIEDSLKLDPNDAVIDNHSPVANDLVDFNTEVLTLPWLEPWQVIAFMKEYLKSNDKELIKELGRAPFPTEEYGDWTIVALGDKTDGSVHYALVYGNAITDEAFQHKNDPLVRIHSACHTSETYHAINCECRQELAETMRRMQEEGAGIILYLQQEGRGNGVVGKLTQLNAMFGIDNSGQVKQKIDPITGEPVNTVQAYKDNGYVSERREFSVAGAMLALIIGVSEVRLVTNNPAKISGLENSGFVVNPVEIHIPPDNHIIANDLMHKAKGDGHNIPEEYWRIPQK